MALIEPLSREDVAMLRLESPTVRGHVLKVAVLGPGRSGAPPDVEALRDRVAERLARAPRLRCALLEPRAWRRAAWVEDPAFDVREHVRRLPTSEPVSEDGLRDAVARVMEEPLERSRPLWTLDVLHPTADGGTCLVWKLHHAMADGMTAMRFGDALLWDAPTAAGRFARGRATAPPARSRVGRALSARRPERLPPTLRRELRRNRHPSPFDGSIGRMRTVAFASLPLGALKRAAKAIDETTTVNDVVLALVAGGLRRWAGGGPLGGLRVRVPVSLRGGESATVANRNSFFVVSLPVTEADPDERLRRISGETARCKRAGDPLVLDTLLADLARVAPPLRRAIERLAGHPRTFALCVSNIAGPVARPTVLGAPVRALYSIAEVGERHGLRVAVVSMADEVHFGLCADSSIVSDLDPLVAGIHAEASALQQLSGTGRRRHRSV